MLNFVFDIVSEDSFAIGLSVFASRFAMMKDMKFIRRLRPWLEAAFLSLLAVVNSSKLPRVGKSDGIDGEH